MSFYGQVMYEFTKMFSKFMVTQHSNSEIPIIPPETPVSKHFEATTMWEQFNIEPTNRWIQLDGDGGNDDIKTIKIGHSTPGVTDVEKTFISLEKIETEDEEITQLKNGDTIKISTLTHDAAGHANSSPTYTYYKLPSARLTIVTPEEDLEDIITPNDEDILQVKGDGQWINLTNDNNALKIAHTIIEADELNEEQKTSLATFNCLIPDEREDNNLNPQSFYDSLIEVDKKTEAEANKMLPILNKLNSDEVIIPLQSGDLIEAYDIVKDNNGHMVGIKPIYYKMPVSATDVAFDDQKNRITQLEERLGGTFPSGIDDTYEELANKVYNNTELIYDTTTGETMYPDYNNGAIPTVYGTIGPVTGDKGFSQAIINLTQEDDKHKTYNVSEALRAITNETLKNSDATKGASARITLLVNKLKELGILEEDIEI